MGCQVNIAHQILEGDGDYFIGAKENQPTLCKSIRILSLRSMQRLSWGWKWQSNVFADSIRKHWLVEDTLHYVLDLSKNEVKSPIYQNNSADNWAILRQMSRKMLRAENTSLSNGRKQKLARVKTDYLDQVLVAGLNEPAN